MTPENPGSIKNRGWTVTLVALSINLVLGVLYAWGVMAKALVVQWHWSKADAALPFTVRPAAFAITMIFAGRLQDKVGPRLIAALGGIVLGSAWWLRRMHSRRR
jgi:OFA family oxalate/formate antiporter-like MFS transporter